VNGDPERDADPNWPGWDAERRCALCGHALTDWEIQDARLLSNGETYFRMCGRCRVEAEAEINEAAHARRAIMEVK
jgi:hypothetical protein